MTTTISTPVRLAVLLEDEGGFSVYPTNGQEAVSGYAVARPEHNRQFGGRVTPEDITEYAYDHAAILMAGGVVLGGWRDRQTGLTHLDVSDVEHDRETALNKARERGELAVWDYARGIEIRTGLSL